MFDLAGQPSTILRQYGGTVSLSPYQEKKFTKVVDSLKPSGWTPLAAAIQAAGEALSAHSEDENAVCVVGGGIKSCRRSGKGSKGLASIQYEAVINLIGFDSDEKSRKSLEQVAKAGGGELPMSHPHGRCRTASGHTFIAPTKCFGGTSKLHSTLLGTAMVL